MPETEPPGCYVGVDAGGSHSRALLTDRAFRPLASCEGPDSNPNRLTLEVAAERLAELIRAVKQEPAARDAGPLRLLACGVAGAGQAATCRQLEAKLLSSFPGTRLVCVISDVEALLEAMLPQPDPVGQVALIAGTGSIAAGRRPDGRAARAGGEGWPVGDRGSGAWIGQQSLAHAHDAASGPSKHDDISARDLAARVPDVVRRALSGDAHARELLERAGRELAATALAVIRELDLGAQSFPLALWGGVFRAGPLIETPLSDTIRAGAPEVRIVRPAAPPELGALRAALRERTESP